MSCFIKKDRADLIKNAILGLLVGDAVGVPYEFFAPNMLPDINQLDMIPPREFPRSYAHVPPGTWSDDGAQTLCLMDSLLSCGHFHTFDFAERLIRWRNVGYFAVDGYVFDIGLQTGRALDRIGNGCTLADSGLRGKRNNGNGSLMRSLPLALLYRGGFPSLIECAHRQSMITHAHPISLVCCALHVVFARLLSFERTQPVHQLWKHAVAIVMDYYAGNAIFENALLDDIKPLDDFPVAGTSYVVDSLHSALWALKKGENYAHVVRLAISLGHDTDTTACIAGGLAALRFGHESIPLKWQAQLRGKELLEPLFNLLVTAHES